jgi:hypothetical protein
MIQTVVGADTTSVVAKQAIQWATILGPLLTALIGGWMGGRLALGRFKRERAFDRRLDWCERAYRSLYRASWKLEAASHQLKRGKREDAAKHYGEAQGIMDEMATSLVEHELYAKEGEPWPFARPSSN